MDRILRLDICDYTDRPLCNIYDSTTQVMGQAYDVFIDYERNGWKELTFSIPSKISTVDGEEDNYRLDYLVADFRIRASGTEETDWFLISEPKITHSNFSKTVDVRAGHISQILKTKNLSLEFSDSEGNNVGTAEELLTTILSGTGWSVGEVYRFLEDNGDIKKRTLNASSKTGAFKLISSLCELFDAKAVYHGEGRTVDLLPLNPFSDEYTEGIPPSVDTSNCIELHYSKNIKSITRTQNTENMITKLYAVGSYGNATTGICTIETCSHEEYTFKNIKAGQEYKFTDNTGGTYYFYIPAGSTVFGTVIWSKLDLLSRSYVWDGSNPFAVTKKPQTANPVTITGTVEILENYVPYLMSFDYYRQIKLMNDDQFKALAQFQRDIPALYKASQEAVAARTEKMEELSTIIKSTTDFLRLSVESVEDDNGHVCLKINTSKGDNGVMYRGDYDETKRNYFSWYVANYLDDDGYAIDYTGSIVFIIHSDDTWSMAYLEKIFNIVDGVEGVIYTNDHPGHYHYALTDGSEPTKITLHSSDSKIKANDRFYLFKANSMGGLLGNRISTDEGIVGTLKARLTNEAVPHPVFFSTTRDESLTNNIKSNAYGWLYVSNINARDWGNANITSALYFCDRSRGETTWKSVTIADTAPTVSVGNYFFNTRKRTLWYGVQSGWTEMDTSDNRRLSNNFSVVIYMCAERERIYKGIYERYVRTIDSISKDTNVAVHDGYAGYWLFSPDMTTASTVSIDTINSRVYQKPDDETTVIPVTYVDDADVEYPSSNIFENKKWAKGNIDENGNDVTNNSYIRTGYVRVYSGQKYKHNLPKSKYSKIFFYDQNKRFLGQMVLNADTEEFTPPTASEVPANVQDITSYTANAYYAKVSIKSTDIENTYCARFENYSGKIIVNREIYTVSTTFHGEGEIIGINALMPRFANLADEAYGVYLKAVQEAQQAIKDRDLEITELLGDMLREGYWQDNNYVEGDEERLYKDSMDNLKEISKPECTYDIDFLDLYTSNKTGFSLTEVTNISWPDIHITDAAHLVDDDLDVSQWGYIDKLHKCFDQPWKTTLQVNTKLTLMDQHDFTDVMTHIADVAKETKAKQTLYGRAAALTGSGTLAADKLEGTLSAYVTQITGGSSNWETDENGNIVFLSTDGNSAMMLSGNGLSIASSKDSNGNWEWKTAATGRGLVADTITARELISIFIQAGGIETDALSSTVGNELDISSNTALLLYATEDGSRPAGSLVTGTSHTDDSGNVTYSNAGPNESYISIKGGDSTSGDKASIDIMSGGNVNIGARSTLNLTGAAMSLLSGSTLDVTAGTINVTSNGKFIVDSKNFKVGSDDSVTITGNINAAGGSIAGFTIGQKTASGVTRTYMYAGSTTTVTSGSEGVYIGTDGINVGGYFKVSKDGSNVYFGGTNINVNGATGAINVKGASTMTIASTGALSIVTNAAMKVGSTKSPFTFGADSNGGTTKNIARSYMYNGMTGVTSAANGVYVGTDGIGLGAGKFLVLADGSATASNLTISGGSIEIKDGNTTNFKVTNTGVLTAKSGTIAGWTIESSYLHAGKDTVDSSGSVTSSTYVGISTGSYAFWAGQEAEKNAPFYVKRNGTLFAKQGTVGGWTLGPDYLGNASSLAKSTIGIRKGTADTDTVFFAGANGKDISTAKFKVTKAGALTATSGNIGGWAIGEKLLYADYTATKASAYVGLDASDDTKNLSWYNLTTGGKSTTAHMFAMWAGNKSPTSAPFSVTKDGVVTIQRLRVNIGTATEPRYIEVPFDKWFSSDDSGGTGDDSWAADISSSMGKLKFQTIKSISVNDSTGQVTIYYTNNNGGTSIKSFNSAGSVKLYAKGEPSTAAGSVVGYGFTFYNYYMKGTTTIKQSAEYNISISKKTVSDIPYIGIVCKALGIDTTVSLGGSRKSKAIDNVTRLNSASDGSMVLYDKNGRSVAGGNSYYWYYRSSSANTSTWYVI